MFQIVFFSTQTFIVPEKGKCVSFAAINFEMERKWEKKSIGESNATRQINQILEKEMKNLRPNDTIQETHHKWFDQKVNDVNDLRLN